MYNVQQAGAVLTIDVGAIADNWRQLAKRVGKAECSAVVKTNAYGLGMTRIAPALSWAGCKTFFVTNVAEGVELRQCLGGQRIFIFHGNYSNTEADFLANDLIPVLNTTKQVADWSSFAKKSGKKLPAALHVDTGMTRLGVTFAELEELLNTPDAFDGIELVMFMSHLACADEKDNPKNALQKTFFSDACKKIKKRWANIEFSFANSAGVFLGEEYLFDVVRPGIALYGCNPCLHQKNPMKPVVRLQGKILHVQDVDTAQTVGYGASYCVPAKGRIATVAVGYGDGFPRSAGNKAYGYIGDIKAPLVGRVSMDLVAFDISAVSEKLVSTESFIDLIGLNNSVDELALSAGTISYEILTNLGQRYFRNYIGD